jgi:hypothetical protein
MEKYNGCSVPQYTAYPLTAFLSKFAINTHSCTHPAPLNIMNIKTPSTTPKKTPFAYPTPRFPESPRSFKAKPRKKKMEIKAISLGK